MSTDSPAPTAAVLIIGNEILSGRTQDINLNHIAKQLTARGIRLAEARIVPDIEDEIVDAVRAIANEAKAGLLDPDAIDRSTISRYLHTAGVPDPDLVIRTSGEKRLSDFLLWESAYAEFHFTETMWPDFAGEHLADALNAFHRRERIAGLRGV